MNEFITKLIERLEENRRPIVTNDEDLEWNRAMYLCTGIVNQLAEEYNNGWIPCSVRLPDNHSHILIQIGFGTPLIYDAWFDNGIFHPQAQSDELLNVKAWQPLPQPYQPKRESSISKMENVDWKQQTMNRFERVE